ncbi:phage terminase large subunit [Sphingomonas sp.]|jgi:hypothetical protein|uniref:phage terminase large subunit n=1 Tax=Sphingomonas sp. TaxID=28214 RepID=UPI000DBC27EC|nr:phage terminase large subunit [Sphingomonas sp.]PZT94153.1 MAG: hypothetical protein DI625_08440 [Sphingomonas sp.]
MSTKPLQGIRPNLDFNEDQRDAYKLATSPSYKFHLFYGGGGSGKSYLILTIIILRALAAAGSRHGIFRLTRNSCDTTLFSKTLHEVFDNVLPGYLQRPDVTVSQQDMTVELHNGSLLMFNGLDENRLKKIDGNEYQTVWLNECNEFTYNHVSVLIGRMRGVKLKADGKELRHKLFADCNPNSEADWEYKAFIQGVNPADGDALPNHGVWVHHKLRPIANLHNVGADYIDNMRASMSAADRKRYVDGDWASANPDATFNEAMFVNNRIPKPPIIVGDLERERDPSETLAMLETRGIGLSRVTVAVDPAVTADPKSDLSGITVQGIARLLNDQTGKWEDHAYVLADYSLRGTPDQVCAVVCQAYKEWGASRVIMENNQGGLWLESTMRSHFPNVPLKFVSATATTGGKASRAEPVSAQYERGMVHHVGTLRELETQMCEFGSAASRRKSPDRMDAVVWGITELLDLGHEKKQPVGMWTIRAPNLW